MQDTFGAVYKGRPANGEGGGWLVLKFRTFPDGGGGVVCESSDIRKFLKKIEIPKLKIIIDRDSNMRAFTYDVSK